MRIQPECGHDACVGRRDGKCVGVWRRAIFWARAQIEWFERNGRIRLWFIRNFLER